MDLEGKNAGRLRYIDFLKFIGLIGIIFAHVDSPEWLFKLRNFDVPLMVIISAILGQRSFQKHKSSVGNKVRFCLERAKRLIYPTWIFLIIYFTVMLLVEPVYKLDYYIDSFLLTQYGVGYIWIILIYLYSALLIPLCDRLTCAKWSWMCVLGIYVFYEIMCYFQVGIDIRFVETTFYYIIPYGALTYLGYNYHRYSKKIKIMIISVSAIVLSACGVYYWWEYGAFQNVQIVKYPPQLYYLAYGIFISFVLIGICENAKGKIFESKLILFVSQHSMWIYLWHILVLYFYKYFHLPEIWYVKFFVVISTSILLVFGVNVLLNLVDRKRRNSWLKYLRY